MFAELFCAYIYTVPDRLPYQTPPLGDVMDKAGVAKFIEVTHEKYAREIGGEFGKSVRTISFKLFGNRYNTFGSLHCKKDKIGELPAMWQPDPPAETHEYLLNDIGILKTPTIFV